MELTELTAQRLRELVSYEPETGVFRWLVTRRMSVGMRAGSLDKKTGYRRIKIDGKSYLEQRLAWLYMTGEWPLGLLDHENRLKNQNWWTNLRGATVSQNLQNVDGHKSKGASHYRGVYRHKKNRCWTAAITVDQKQKHLGVFKCETSAYVAYCRAKSELHTFAVGG